MAHTTGQDMDSAAPEGDEFAGMQSSERNNTPVVCPTALIQEPCRDTPTKSRIQSQLKQLMGELGFNTLTDRPLDSLRGALIRVGNANGIVAAQELSCHERIYLGLHWIGHILFGHIDIAHFSAAYEFRERSGLPFEYLAQEAMVDEWILSLLERRAAGTLLPPYTDQLPYGPAIYGVIAGYVSNIARLMRINCKLVDYIRQCVENSRTSFGHGGAQISKQEACRQTIPSHERVCPEHDVGGQMLSQHLKDIHVSLEYARFEDKAIAAFGMRAGREQRSDTIVINIDALGLYSTGGLVSLVLEGLARSSRKPIVIRHAEITPDGVNRVLVPERAVPMNRRLEKILLDDSREMRHSVGILTTPIANSRARTQRYRCLRYFIAAMYEKVDTCGAEFVEALRVGTTRVRHA